MDDEQTDAGYDHRAIETKWQQRWREQRTFRTEEDGRRRKFYGLVFFPYPSGAGISVGHCRNYIPVDVACRHKAMQGYNVLQPMGWDAFGLPAENEAIAKGRNPRAMVPEYARNYRRQLDLVGIAYDWDREIDSSRSEYYRWTQWLFLLLYRRGLAYRADTPINWCPSCRTGLANEEVAAGNCWRCGAAVLRRLLPQWSLRITAYADRLLSGLDTVRWPEGIKAMQREWIGRSDGVEIDFALVGHASMLRVFTTRPDTLWGATFMVLAPEHPLVLEVTTTDRLVQVNAYLERARGMTDTDRQSANRTKTGVFTGARAVNPVTGEAIPVYVADYVLMTYGTGAIMAVPAHDQRDFAFAREHGIRIRLVYESSDGSSAEAFSAAMPRGGRMAAFSPPSDAATGPDFPFAGRPQDDATIGAVKEWLQDRGVAKPVVHYRLRDWLISRQRYWGAPIPIVHCDTCGLVSVPEADLPVRLPEIEQYQPTGTGASPLAGIDAFVNTPCPRCRRPARRETDTMGGFACSSWYFLRFADPHNPDEPFSRAAADAWLPVDLYCGGAEHAVMHLLYARFWTKVMHDAGLIGFDEPFQELRNQGMLLAWTPGREFLAEQPRCAPSCPPTPASADRAAAVTGSESDWKPLRPEDRASIAPVDWVYRWVKMSKSKGNVVTPDEIAERYGADTLRMYTLFVAPFEETVKWEESGVQGAHRFLKRVWGLWTELRVHHGQAWRETLAASGSVGLARDLRRRLHQTIRKVGEDIQDFRFNTAVAALMELTNQVSGLRKALTGRPPDPGERATIAEWVEVLPLLLAPIAPHIAEEMWERLGKTGSVYRATWPTVDEAVAADDLVRLAVQINGKLRDHLSVPAGASNAEVERLALGLERIASCLAGARVQRVILVPGRLVNFVVG